MKLLPLLALTFLFSCNIKQDVESEIEIAKEDMKAEIQKAKKDFTAYYQASEEIQPDSLNKLKLAELKFSIISTDNYLDSLKREMDKLDEDDVKNVEVVKATFLFKGAGDSIINKLKHSIAAAHNAASTEQQKLAIKNASDSLFAESSNDKWKEQMFGLTNPFGASMMIYGLQKELYNIGMKALGGE